MPEPSNQAVSALAELRAAIKAQELTFLSIGYKASRLEHLFAASLGCSLLELATCIAELAKGKSTNGVPILLRSVLEQAVRANFVAKNPVQNILSLELTDNLERLNFLEDKSHTNPDAKRLLDRNKEIKRRGAKDLRFRDLLAAVDGMQWNYLYSMLSAASHGQLSSLSWHHMTYRPEGSTVAYMPPMPDHVLEAYLLQASELLMYGIDATCQVLRSDA